MVEKKLRGVRSEERRVGKECGREEMVRQKWRGLNVKDDIF